MDFFPCPLPLIMEHRPLEEELWHEAFQWMLNPSWSMIERWGSLVTPPDYVASDIALIGLKLKWLGDPPPLHWRDNPPERLFTNKSKVQILEPFAQDWVKRGILTTLHIPARVYFSWIFYVPKKNGKFCPILDLSCLNIYVQTPRFVEFMLFCDVWDRFGRLTYIGKLTINFYSSS